MTDAQRCTVEDLTLGFDVVHHGDCLGADLDMHTVARSYGLSVEIHPPTDSRFRAWCNGDKVWPEKPYLARNHDIVDACDVLLATPAQVAEQVRSGTWSTIRYARQAGRAVRIVTPDGVVLP